MKVVGFDLTLSISLMFATIHSTHALGLFFLPLPAGLFGLLFGLIGVFAQDGEKVRESGILQGYNNVTWAVVILQVDHLYVFYKSFRLLTSSLTD